MHLAWATGHTGAAGQIGLAQFVVAGIELVRAFVGELDGDGVQGVAVTLRLLALRFGADIFKPVQIGGGGRYFARECKVAI